ncbi:Cobalt transport protein CbiN [Desulforamulus reducens MI-1]|uniref:Cobalt transport protein CbiN n=1 Tax=Desulforamulus reducens (strain ATCC BAA-1160 / DSM 100696 / MI-1) TaxID=349161 RepID=A4J833_DESRM|nr:energy-coupling factor ABC transporter substrate-binding protein [Desulforamulus reducens]ABO51236.1 Cobalt transport protein CbiN [Desulforamulus reducens MI-1]
MISSTRKLFSENRLLNYVLLGTVLILLIVPLLFLPNAPFEGADGQIEKVITQVDQNYQPWFEPLWEPPSTEVESFLFALQAAIGAGMVGYIIGFWHGKRKAAKKQGVS